jgi:hypothetical protein
VRSIITDKASGNVVIGSASIHVNLSPDAFYRWATHWYEAKRQFVPPHKFSPVPWAILCRAIELVIKARHLTGVKQKDVKYKYGHNLTRAYRALEPGEQVLTADDERVLEQASELYDAPKAFEYFRPVDALTGYKSFPDLDMLDRITRKLLDASKDLDLPRQSQVG